MSQVGHTSAVRVAGRVAKFAVWFAGVGTAAVVLIVVLAFVAVAGLALASDEIGLTSCSRADGVNHRC